jgi:hypothetical protein
MLKKTCRLLQTLAGVHTLVQPAAKELVLQIYAQKKSEASHATESFFAI